MKQFLTDDKSQFSSMRLMALLTTIAALFIAVWYTIAGASPLDLSLIVTPMLTTAFGGKAIQKRAENVK